MVDGILYTNAYNCGRFSARSSQLYLFLDLGQVEQVHHVMTYAYDTQEMWAGAEVYVGPHPEVTLTLTLTTTLTSTLTTQP